MAKVLEAEDQHEQTDGDRDRGDGGVGQLACDREQVAEEAGLLDVHSEQLGDLVDHDHQPDAGLEAREHRL